MLILVIIFITNTFFRTVRTTVSIFFCFVPLRWRSPKGGLQSRGSAHRPSGTPPDGVIWSDTFRMPACLPILSLLVCEPAVYQYFYCRSVCVIFFIHKRISTVLMIATPCCSELLVVLIRYTFFFLITKAREWWCYSQSRLWSLPTYHLYVCVFKFLLLLLLTIHLDNFFFGFLDAIFKILTEKKKEKLMNHFDQKQILNNRNVLIWLYDFGLAGGWIFLAFFWTETTKNGHPLFVGVCM